MKIGKWVFCNIRGETNTADSSAGVTCRLPFSIGYYYRMQNLIVRIQNTWYSAYAYNSANQPHLGLYSDGNLSTAITSITGENCYLYGNLSYSIA